MPSSGPCDCPGCANVFSRAEAEKDLRSYRQDGPSMTTRTLIAAIVEQGIDGATVIDIGGGIGAIQLELLEAGAASTVSVDASPDYAAVAREEAGRRGFAERTVHLAGDFVALAVQLDPADIVTLDKAVCCYQDAPALVGRSAQHARRMVGLVYPRDSWWVRAAARLLNAGSRVARSATRFYIHRQDRVDAVIRAAGFDGGLIKQGFLWSVFLYLRPDQPPRIMANRATDR